MYSTRFQELKTRGFSLSNKRHFRQWNQYEFDEWIDECRSLLSCCEPEPDGFPWCPDPRHIEEIVMMLSATERKISRGQIEYTGIF